MEDNHLNRSLIDAIENPMNKCQMYFKNCNFNINVNTGCAAPCNNSTTQEPHHAQSNDEDTGLTPELTHAPSKPQIPQSLQTPQAHALLNRLRDLHLLTDEFLPNVSNIHCAYIAYWASNKLEIATPWITFGEMWDIRPETLRTYFNRAMESRNIAELIDILNNNRQHPTL